MMLKVQYRKGNGEKYAPQAYGSISVIQGQRKRPLTTKISVYIIVYAVFKDHGQLKRNGHISLFTPFADA
jgi:hypothetical protein